MEEFDASVAARIAIITAIKPEKNDNIVFLATFTVYLSLIFSCI